MELVSCAAVAWAGMDEGHNSKSITQMAGRAARATLPIPTKKPGFLSRRSPKPPHPTAWSLWKGGTWLQGIPTKMPPGGKVSKTSERRRPRQVVEHVPLLTMAGISPRNPQLPWLLPCWDIGPGGQISPFFKRNKHCSIYNTACAKEVGTLCVSTGHGAFLH